MHCCGFVFYSNMIYTKDILMFSGQSVITYQQWWAQHQPLLEFPDSSSYG
jgi:hypothetical protein